MMIRVVALIWLSAFVCSCSAANAETILVDGGMRPMRADGPAEWSEFGPKADSKSYKKSFKARANSKPATLRLRQQDVKQTWNVLLNDKPLGKLVQDENDQTLYLPIPAEMLVDGDNTIAIEQKAARKPIIDDIRIGEIVINDRPIEDVLNESKVTVRVSDKASGELLPAKLTIIHEAGCLQTVGAKSNDHLAVRTGVVYTASGVATFGLPTGKYRIIAGRGFEYSIDSRDFKVSKGDEQKLRFHIVRQVNTSGYVACDTHVHTRTHSGHGDATVIERMITLAGEGIELPIATDHNVQIDHRPFAKTAKVNRYFTPVVGNEVTTKVGHFNIFPAKADGPRPDHTLTNWGDIFDSIDSSPTVKVAILNHGRDLHSGVRPLGPKLFNASVGKDLGDRDMRFNAMEIINSGAIQTNPLELTYDWMALLNSGRQVTPVGSSDSHDVCRYIVGQGRTYIRCDDAKPESIDIDQAVENFVKGRVMVSYGLATELVVNEKYQPGDVCPATFDDLNIEVRVLGPDWVQATKVSLFANGVKIREQAISAIKSEATALGVQGEAHWRIANPKHDVHYVAIATGPGIESLHWKTAKPYQPTSPDFTPMIFGVSGAVWFDADGDGERTSARHYATSVYEKSKGDLAKLVASLTRYDQAVAAQAAHLVADSGRSPLSDEVQTTLRTATQETKRGFQIYASAWRKTQQAAE